MSLAWDLASVKAVIVGGSLPEEFYLIGDEAFVNSQQLLVPWSGRGLGPRKDSFNYHLSAMIQCIEIAFGLLTRRWGFFWRSLTCRFKKWATVCTVAAKLHNFCISQQIPLVERAFCDHVEGDEWVVHDNEEENEEIRVASGSRRRDITDQLEIDGILRPRFAFHNSRA